jgi:hypothetical protein
MPESMTNSRCRSKVASVSLSKPTVPTLQTKSLAFRAGRPAGRFVLQGKSEALAVLEPLTPSSAVTSDIEAYLEAYRMLENGQPGAKTAFGVPRKIDSRRSARNISPRPYPIRPVGDHDHHEGKVTRVCKPAGH